MFSSDNKRPRGFFLTICFATTGLVAMGSQLFQLNEKQELIRTLQAPLPPASLTDLPTRNDVDEAPTATIPLNPLLREDHELSIHHHAHDNKIVVTLQKGARCPHPYLIGRLSGPALVKIEEWTWRNDDQDSKTILEGTYRVPVGGHYFLEVISLYCEDFFYDFTQRAQRDWEHDNWLDPPSTLNDLMGFEFRNVCMERQRLTSSDAAIWIDPESALRARALHQNQQQWTGFWWHKNWTTITQQQQQSSASPVLTRYQPAHCYEAELAKEPLSEDCLVATSTDRFADYEFQWWLPGSSLSSNIRSTDKNSNYDDNQLDVRQLVQPQPTVVCLVGFSHSRGLYEAAQSLGLFSNTTNVTVVHVKAKYPNDVTPQRIQRDQETAEATCDKLVVAVGQWPGSYKRGHPTLLDHYYEGFNKMMQRLKSDEATKDVEIYLRSVHYQGLGATQLACPPTDWRSPRLIEAYNIVVRKVCQEWKIEYLDTTHIDGAIWDSASDWNHLEPATNELEMLYLAARMLGVGGDGSLATTTAEK